MERERERGGINYSNRTVQCTFARGRTQGYQISLKLIGARRVNQEDAYSLRRFPCSDGEGDCLPFDHEQYESHNGNLPLS
jgi:hypothetical protein